MAAFRRSSRRTTRRRYRPRPRRVIRRRTLRYRRSYQRSRMSRRRVLNIASNKKKDNRLLWNNVANNTLAMAQGPIVLTAGTNYIIPYVVTAMDVDKANAYPSTSYRESDHVYMRGYKETLRFNFTNGAAWQWRRIAFCMKGERIYQYSTTNVALNLETSPNGWVRSATQANGTPLGNELLNILFDGTLGVDWDDLFSAKVDTARVDLKYDQLRSLRGGNGEPRWHTAKIWHPMNKNFIYTDDENGNNQTRSVWHTDAKPGMGDYYIVDFIQCASSTTGSGSLNMEGCLYWHER